ncbi:thermonuclease family protein [Arthrobacter sp. H14-L1]|uniref:thermonuclease family protein n=1 Tax=Arthrobacter sp. H14-L1 TaxID=2996697 RepID=UPI00226E0F70|nr:thermonuclease family protein [Arthrobacter sp. H14-L1]MCY0905021.1 thermonuclease family protein [Arthrobacter sp. H14-L1]
MGTKPPISRRKTGTILAATVVLAFAAGLVSCSAAPKPTSGEVVRIVDGATLVVTINKRDQTVHLLNVDTPQPKDASSPVECLEPEAEAYLKSTMPPGSHITMELDDPIPDQSGRILAAVYNESGQLVDAGVARKGLGIPVSSGANTKYLATVRAAHDEARAAGIGLFSTSIPCTLPAQIEESMTALETSMDSAAAQTSGAAVTAIAAAVAALASAKVVHTLLSAGTGSTKPILWAAFSAADVSRHLARVTAGIDRMNATIPVLENRRDELLAADTRAAADKAAAEAAEAAAAVAAEQAVAAQAAREAAAQDAASREAVGVSNLPAPYVPPAPPPYVPPAAQPYVAPPVAPAPAKGYTGPRCYAPGGKTYRPC